MHSLDSKAGRLTSTITPPGPTVVLAAGDATRLLLADEIGFEYWRWFNCWQRSP